MADYTQVETLGDRPNDPLAKEKMEFVELLMSTVPDHLKEHMRVANLHHARGDRQKAMEMYKEAIIHAPNAPFPLFCLGTILGDTGENALSMALMMRSLELEPRNPEGWNNLGTCFKTEHKDDAARECYDNSLKVMRHPATLANLSGCFINNGCPEQAIAPADEAIKLSNEHGVYLPQAHNHMGLALLELSEYKTAWPHWEHRIHLPDWKGMNRTKCGIPRWDGKPTDKKVLICGEQGVGDEILFGQLFQRVYDLCPNMALELNYQVAPGFARVFPEVPIYLQFDEAVRHFQPDMYLESGSLMAIFDYDPREHEHPPFISLDQGKVKAWRKRLEALGPGPYVGLTWHGGVKKTSTHYRAVPLEDLWHLRRAKATFVSVQYGDHAPDAVTLGLPHWTEQAYDLDERWHLIEACDLIITVCQTAVHMAGAIGKECWVLVPSRPAWRYALEGDMNHWYGTVRHIRQKGDNWKQVVGKARTRLDKWLKERKG